MSESPAEFINSVNDNVSRLQSFGPSETEQALGGLGLQLFQILQQIVPVIDESGDVSLRYFPEWPLSDILGHYPRRILY